MREDAKREKEGERKEEKLGVRENLYFECGRENDFRRRAEDRSGQFRPFGKCPVGSKRFCNIC